MSLLSPCSVGFGPFFMPETFCRRPRDASEIVYSPSRGEPSEPIYSATSTELFASARAAKSENPAGYLCITLEFQLLSAGSPLVGGVLDPRRHLLMQLLCGFGLRRVWDGFNSGKQTV